ncbi:c-type cytochrome [Dyadobacter sandarakinus]|uniref:Cytochrome c domain-containing protein n=1 Tax=Dyadobacter sandarakinus TaxID=2747268 RepID=A0ABX7IAB4_9BACT|nr:hypothetical protein [Dyadobacter sandarakinus]QRR03039.1 hypothetical protein HWI92_20060 [Dyadobacter sandarakinus]
MTLKHCTSAAFTALAVSLLISCSSKEDKEKYDYYYGSGSKVREEAALVKLQNDRKNPVDESAPMATPAAAPAQADAAKPAGDSAAAKTADASKAGAEAAPAGPPKRKPVPADVLALVNKHACFACHQAYDKVIGPAYSDVAKKKYTTDQIVELVHSPKPEHWPGYPPMAPMPHVPKGDIVVIATWINSL